MPQSEYQIVGMFRGRSLPDALTLFMRGLALVLLPSKRLLRTTPRISSQHLAHLGMNTTHGCCAITFGVLLTKWFGKFTYTFSNNGGKQRCHGAKCGQRAEVPTKACYIAMQYNSGYMTAFGLSPQVARRGIQSSGADESESA